MTLTEKEIKSIAFNNLKIKLDKKQIKWIEKKICAWYGERCDAHNPTSIKAWEFFDDMVK
jgi:hypothetical protein